MFYLYTLLFLIGLAFGSFASVLIHRIHKKERGILFGRSKCPECSTTLKTLDLIPVISIFINKFKCRYCEAPIAFNYLFLELTMGIAFFVTALLTGPHDITLLLFNLFIAFVFVTLTFYDIRYQEVPDQVVLPAIVVSALFILLTDAHSWQSFLTGATVPIVFFGFLFFISRGYWLGGGDIRIGALMGVLLGWPDILTGLFLAYLFGSVYSAIGIITKKLHRKSHIPFAPFLLIGAYITIFWGREIMEWYLRML